MATTTGFSSEKGGYNLNNNGQALTTDPALAGKRRNSVNEGTEMYGDIGSVEEYGYVERALKSRHIQFIALGGTIGTGLFGMLCNKIDVQDCLLTWLTVGIGGALYNSGPLSILLGYSIMGFFI